MVDADFVVTDEWLDHFRPTRGSSWTQSMLTALDAELWPRGRRSPVAGWRDLVRGRIISHAQRAAFETEARQSIHCEIKWHAEALEAARRRLAVLDAPSMPERPELAGWETWQPAPGVM